MTTIRTRFAPSPTGYLHVGGLRTALYAYLLAKKNAGQFLLRIEDTDQSRLVPGATENIIETMRWAGIEFDEGPGKEGPYGPYIQSERLALYQHHAQQLVAQGKAYYCFCSAQRLEQVRTAQIAHKLPPAYDKHCRNLGLEVAEEKRANGDSFVIRMKIPTSGECTFFDEIRGNVTFSYKVIDDQVILKSDGFPTYHLAVVVDDHFMKITHVIRGEEWLSSTPKHLLLYDYFGWQAPQFAHLPLLLNNDRSKLSKRQGDVAVEDYRRKGYLPEALVNFIAFLGWNPGDEREFFSLKELVQEFSLAGVGKAGAVFNIEKLDWMNGQYLQKTSTERIIELLQELPQAPLIASASPAYVGSVVELLKERMTVLPDFFALGSYFFTAPTSYDPAIAGKAWKQETGALLAELASTLEALDFFDAAMIETATRNFTTQKQIGMGALIQPLRLALSGVGQGPSLYSIIALLGKHEVSKRLAQAMVTLN